VLKEHQELLKILEQLVPPVLQALLEPVLLGPLGVQAQPDFKEEPDQPVIKDHVDFQGLQIILGLPVPVESLARLDVLEPQVLLGRPDPLEIPAPKEHQELLKIPVRQAPLG
jgi:hypothetical protein